MVLAGGCLVVGQAQADPVGTAQQITEYDPPVDFNSGGGPAIAYNPATGKTLAVFTGPNPGGPGNVGILQVGLVTANGSLVSAPVSLPTNVRAACASCSDPPNVAAGGDGSWLVTWPALDGGGDDKSIGGQIVGSGGQPVGENFVLSSQSVYRDIETTDAAWSEADSRYLVTWKANVVSAFPGALGDQQIVGRFIDAAGQGLGDDFLVTEAEEIDNAQEVDYGNGIWVAVGASPDGVVGQVVEETGPVGEVYGIAGEGSYSPSIAFNPETSDFLVVYRDGGDNLGYGVLLDREGTPGGSPFIFGDGAQLGGRPRVASAGSNGYLATWHGRDLEGIWGVEIGAGGSEEGTPALLSDAGLAPNDDTWRPSVAYSVCAGRYLTVWAQEIAGSSESNYYTRPWFLTDPLPEPCPGNPSETLTLTKSGTGTGTVTSSPEGIDCGATCSAEFEADSTVTLTATAASGSSFTGWSGACSGTGTCEVTMSEARSVDAAFAADPNLRVSIGGAKKARAGKSFRVGIQVTNRQLLTRSAETRLGPVKSVRTCLTLPRTLFVVRASGANLKAHQACWTRRELAVGFTVTYVARIRVAKSAASTRAVARLRASVTASGEDGGQVSVSGSRQIRVLPARVPRPQPPTG